MKFAIKLSNQSIKKRSTVLFLSEFYNEREPNFLKCISGSLPFQIGGFFELNQIYDSPPTKTTMSDFQLPQPIPQLVHEHSQNVTAVLGKAALLNCRVRGIGNKTVSKLSC